MVKRAVNWINLPIHFPLLMLQAGSLIEIFVVSFALQEPLRIFAGYRITPRGIFANGFARSLSAFRIFAKYGGRLGNRRKPCFRRLLSPLLVFACYKKYL